MLVDAGFQAQQRDAILAGVCGQMFEQGLAQAAAPEVWADVHAL